MTYIFNLTEMNSGLQNGQYYFESLEELCKAAKQLYKSYLNLTDNSYVEPDCLNSDIIMDKLKGSDLLYNHNFSVKIISHNSYTLWASTSLI